MNRYLPATVFVVVFAIGAGMTAVVYNAEETAMRTRFQVVADDAADRIRERVNQQITFLVAVQSFFEANQGDVSQKAFAIFTDGLDRENRLEGLQGMGFARMIPATADAEARIEAELAANYNLTRKPWPETDQDTRTPIVLLEPNDARNRAALGYDMFSETTRRAAMLGAVARDAPHASAPVQLEQEISNETQMGFLVYVPLRSKADEDGLVSGFVYAPFRAADLHMTAFGRLPQLPVVVETMDTSLGENGVLFRSKDFDMIAADSQMSAERTIQVAGRDWTLFIHDTPAYRDSTSRLGTFALGAISLLLAAALSASTRSQLKAISTASQLHALSEKALKDKDMMLQEMKHRLKNSISRVLAISRQTAVHSKTIEEFSSSFSDRLLAMANAQDVLTRSHWQRADLRELLLKELEQVFGKILGESKISGPPVELNERATQALGLVFHELATNALKYGGLLEQNGDLSIEWRIEKSRSGDILALDWTEISAAHTLAAEGHGFGTRLIDANIKGELKGTIERSFETTGITAKIVLPMENCV